MTLPVDLAQQTIKLIFGEGVELFQVFLPANNQVAQTILPRLSVTQHLFCKFHALQMSEFWRFAPAWSVRQRLSDAG